MFLNIYKIECNGQVIKKQFFKDSLQSIIDSAVYPHKKIPEEFSSAIKVALNYYPELKSSKIIFRVKKQSAPLAARPSVFSVFRRAAKRKYIVIICNRIDSKLSPILLKNLSTNSQIGVIGHELSHISDYNSRLGIYFIKLVCMHFSKKAIDKFEYATDKRCIAHGLGYQLLSWSEEVRLKLNLLQWRGAKQLTKGGRERYMNPETIVKTMKLFPIYN
ncbi:hypothetical protein [Aurantibacillus circumpalustris]|uniref:hypothetical protein n=1 Tax=Aurantibacillus circumpalustris TaxID=3036359 RepID=UPI00295AADE2|nr:hypothetical protein [Aurantibacillus circumpalustris]